MLAISLLVGSLLGLLGPAIGFIIVGVRARSRARTIGLIGFGIAAAVAVLNQLVSRALPSIVLQRHLPLESVATALGVVTTLLGLIPLIVLAIAISANRQPQQTQQPAPMNYGSYQPPPSAS